MHREFKDLLHSAEGRSRRIIAIFLDVRGFSSFAGIAESTDTAEFLKSVYLKILDEYFPQATFFKPTGDGLMVLSGYDRDSLTDAVCSATDTSIRLVENFPSICEQDPMINFEVPAKLGVGLARGSATALEADGKVLDYSGRPLNLAARLMDLARPSGLVLDDTFGYELLPEEVQQRLSRESAYIKGIAEDDPMAVYTLDGFTEIPEYNKNPMNRFKPFTEPNEAISFKDLEERTPVYRHPLMHTPIGNAKPEIHVRYPRVQANGRKHPALHRTRTLKAEHVRVAGHDYAQVDYSTLVNEIKGTGVKRTWQINITVEYSINDDS